ncbi:hypothetical protein PHJA_001132300 [Phtheirospermum japonicum]|uniref:RRM domain-containing protein n=1 Tax=Phtheirospermum japonicum TaxID=374723 RepID=A0A830C3D7_9LAMI|nr:hypothetical protein PHJA_001132300 [Phtheirospermum japonicum]
MSPKPAAATATSRWGRTFPNTARKSIPNSNPTTPTNPPPPSPTTAVTPPTSTASPQSQYIHTSNAETTLPKPPHTTTVPHPRSLPKTLDSNLGLVNSDLGNKYEESGKSIEPEPGAKQSGPEKIIHVETLSVVGSGDGNKNTANLSFVPSHLEHEGSVKPVMGPEIGADGVAGPGNVKKMKKKKIVKKVVRVVKKVIKKRVPKKVLVHDSENQGLMVKAEEGEVTEISSFDNNEIEKSNSVDELIDEPSIVNEANVISKITDDITENLNLVNDDVIEKSNEIMEKANITNDVDRKLELVNSVGLSEPVNGETSKLDFGASEQIVKTGNDEIPCVPDSMEIVNHITENVMEMDIFVGGLDRKKTKGDDIKKVFEEVGVVVEICGKQCNVAPVGKILLGNFDKNWKTEYVVTLLERAGIEKIVKVTRKKKKSSLAFLEFETGEDAQIAFNKLRKKDSFGKNAMVEVEWAEPDEEDNLNVKSVYAEYLPSSWDEEKVREYFKRFGEIENVVLATDISTSGRKDSAYIHYTNRDAALRCIELVGKKRSGDHNQKVMIAVSLANLNPTSKPMECTPDRTCKQPPIAKSETIQNTVWSRLGTRNTEQRLSISEISAEQHDRLSHIPLKRPASSSDEAMAKLAVIISRSQRGFANPELTNELNSLKKDNAKLRSEVEKSQAVVRRLMDVADTFRTRAKSQEGEIKNLENENATLRAEMDKLQEERTKRIDEARAEGVRAGHQGFPESKDGLALIQSVREITKRAFLRSEEFWTVFVKGAMFYYSYALDEAEKWASSKGFNEKLEREGPLGEAPDPPCHEFCKEDSRVNSLEPEAFAAHILLQVTRVGGLDAIQAT